MLQLIELKPLSELGSFNCTSRVEPARLAKRADFNESSEPARIILHLIETKLLPELGLFIFMSRVEPSRANSLN